MGKIGDKLKGGLRFGIKAAVVGGALLGIKSEYDGVKRGIKEDKIAIPIYLFI